MYKSSNCSIHFHAFVIVFFLCFVRHGLTVRVECKPTPLKLMLECDVGLTTSLSTISVVEQDDGSYCIKNRNFYLVMNGTNSYIWAMIGCSAIFDVHTPPSLIIWSSWGPCSVTCGAGIRRRSRSCNTGVDVNCSTLKDWTLVTQGCNLGDCSTAPKSLPMCGFSPRGFRVLGGEDADECQFPWMAMIHKPGTDHRCGGSIVDQTHILTAAHCLKRFDAKMIRSIQDKPESLLVYTGSSKMPILMGDNPQAFSGLLEHKVARVDIHQDYSSFNLANDIAVLTLTHPIEYDRCNVPVCVVNSQMSVYDASQCGTMGWGKTSNTPEDKGTNKLQWTRLAVVGEETCRYYYGVSYQPKAFCAGGNGHDACGGDSGGPMVCLGPGGRYYQHGIVSSGMEDICGQVGGQYTKLQNYTQWLEQHAVSVTN